MAGLSYATVVARGNGGDIGLEPTTVQRQEDQEQRSSRLLHQVVESQARHYEVDPTKHRSGEQLPENSYQNFARFIIRDT